MSKSQGSIDPLDELLEEIDNVVLDRCDLWPPIPTDDDRMIIIGDGTPRMKCICKLIRQNEITINQLTRRLRAFPPCSKEKDQFYNEFILPLEERGFRLLAILELVIRMEFSDKLMDKNQDAVIGVGKKGKVFYLPFDILGSNRLYKKAI